MGPSITINIEELEMPADGSYCEDCKELITGIKYQNVIFVDEIMVVKNKWYCKYCYDKPGKT